MKSWEPGKSVLPKPKSDVGRGSVPAQGSAPKVGNFSAFQNMGSGGKKGK